MHATNEPIRACAACQKVHGIIPVPGTSHGTCKRHTLESYADLVSHIWARKREAVGEVIGDTLASYKAVASRPESDFCPDLGERKAAA